MNILKMINLKSFLKYKLWILVLILVIIQTSLNKYMDKKIRSKTT
jgi:hypothetical protein